MTYPQLTHHQVKAKLIEWWDKQELTCAQKYKRDNNISNYFYLARLKKNKICTTTIDHLICTHDIKDELQEYINRGQILKAADLYNKHGIYREKAFKLIADGKMSDLDYEDITFALYIKDEEK